MNFFNYIVSACLSLVMISNAVAQSDSGISRHNYKHPTKAKLAKATKQEGVTIRTFDYHTAAHYQAMRNNVGGSKTPKYAPRYSSVVIPVKSVDRSNELNPLKNPGNYKTHSSSANPDSQLVASMD